MKKLIFAVSMLIASSSYANAPCWINIKTSDMLLINASTVTSIEVRHDKIFIHLGNGVYITIKSKDKDDASTWINNFIQLTRETCK